MAADQTAPDVIEVTVEGDDLTYVFRGPDAAARHDQWALDGAATCDEIVPSDSSR